MQIIFTLNILLVYLILNSVFREAKKAPDLNFLSPAEQLKATREGCYFLF